MVTDRENISEKRVKYQRFVDVVLSSAPVWNLPWMGDDLGRAIATKTDGKCGGRPAACPCQRSGFSRRFKAFASLSSPRYCFRPARTCTVMKEPFCLTKPTVICDCKRVGPVSSLGQQVAETRSDPLSDWRSNDESFLVSAMPQR